MGLEQAGRAHTPDEKGLKGIYVQTAVGMGRNGQNVAAEKLGYEIKTDMAGGFGGYGAARLAAGLYRQHHTFSNTSDYG